MKSISFTIPEPPPSLNNIYANVGRRRVKTSKYKCWRDSMALYVRALRLPACDGPVSLHLSLPRTTRGDADNRLKPTADMVKAAGLIVDDNMTRVPLMLATRSQIDDFTTITLTPFTGREAT